MAAALFTFPMREWVMGAPLFSFSMREWAMGGSTLLFNGVNDGGSTLQLVQWAMAVPLFIQYRDGDSTLHSIEK